MRTPIAPRPADFFFDPSRASLKPLEIAALAMAYDWCALKGTKGRLTRDQFVQACPQILAQGVPIDDLIQDLLADNQLELVGTVYQLPVLSGYDRRAAHAAAEKERYHSNGRRDRNSHRAHKARNDVDQWDGTGCAPTGLGTKSPSRKRYPDERRAEKAAAPEQARDNFEVEFVSNDNCSDNQDSAHVCVPNEADPHTPSGSSSASEVDLDQNKYPTSTLLGERVGSGIFSKFDQRAEAEPEQTPDPKVDAAESSAPGEPGEAAAPDLDELDERARAKAEAMPELSEEATEALKRVMDNIQAPVSQWPAARRRREHCKRRAWSPPPWLIARWIAKLPIEQIVKDVVRYRCKGKFDLIAAADHDRVFEGFLGSSERWNRRKHLKAVAVQGEGIRAELFQKRQQAQPKAQPKPKHTQTVKPHSFAREDSLEVANV